MNIHARSAVTNPASYLFGGTAIRDLQREGETGGDKRVFPLGKIRIFGFKSFIGFYLHSLNNIHFDTIFTIDFLFLQKET